MYFISQKQGDFELYRSKKAQNPLKLRENCPRYKKQVLFGKNHVTISTEQVKINYRVFREASPDSAFFEIFSLIIYMFLLEKHIIYRITIYFPSDQQKGRAERAEHQGRVIDSRAYR